MSSFEYQPQDWSNFREDLNMETNIELGGVATPERMEHMEEGIQYANYPLVITIEPGSDDITNIDFKDGRKYVQIISSSLEPKRGVLNIVIEPSKEDTTTVNDTDKARNVIVKSTAVEPKWPSKLEFQLIPDSVRNDAVVEDDIETDTRKIIIYSTFLNTVAIKPVEREIVIDIEDWKGSKSPFEAEIQIEAEINPNSFVKFTKGLEITKEQIAMMNECGVQVIENLDGTFKAIATEKIPTMDIPLHVSIL